MAIKVHFDSAGAPQPLRLILATKAGNRIRELPINAVKFKDDLMSGTEINFEVHKERCVNRDGAVDESFWRRITDFKLAYCPEIDRWYELHVELNERDDTMKAVQAISLGEAELSQINLYDIEINTEDDIARDDYEPTVLYNATNPDASLLDRMIKKAPHYRIAHVDESIADIQRTFQFDDKTIYDAAQEVAEEIGCLFRFDCVKASNGKIDRTISVYDLENYCTSCGYRGDFTSQCEKCGSTAIREGYGKNTSVFVSRENLADDVVYTTDTDSVKNCFRLEAGDDLMTATVINCNPNGTQYLWYVSDEMMEDMSDALRSRIAAYNTLYDSYQNTDSFAPDSNLLSRYNTIVSKYSSMNPDLETITSPIVGYPALMNALYDTIDLQLYLNSGLMPSAEIASTDAAREAAKLTVANLSPAAVANLSSCTKETAANAVLGMAKCLVRGSFQVKVGASSYNASTHKWTGNFEVTNYSDETDTATSASVAITITDDMETYIKQKLDRAMKKESDDATDISAVFKLGRTDFIAELRKYSLQRLLSFRTACQAVLDILIQQGVGDKESWASQANDLYTNLYLPYRQKAADIEAEIAVRTNEIAVVAGVYDQNGGVVTNGMQSVLDARRTQIKEALDFESYLGEELWLEFASFRREDTYSNTNYISDGLDNAQLFSLAREFVATAQKEIYRSATMQHSIRSELKNLLSMAEFSPIVNDFAVGNWIRVKVDGSVYRLRLSAYELDYDSWTLGSVTFTDVKYGHSSASDISSLLDAIRSMQTSYGAVMRQAEQGQKTYSRMNNWASEGFSLTTKIVGGAENQEFVMDETGFTGRELIPETDEYSDEQIKIIANGIYVTDDGWETVRAGLGKFVFWNPETQQYETRFGVIADTVVSPIILSQNVGVYNQSGDVKIDENGITIIADESNNETVFQILRRGEGGSLTNLLSIDGNGNLILSTYAQKSDTVKDVEVQYAVGDDSSTAPSTGWSSDTPQWTSGKYVWQRTKIIDGNDGISYSDPVCIQGASGSQGVGISSVAEYYAVSSSNSTAPGDSSFDTAVPTMDTTNRYLWAYELITYTNGSTSRTAKRVIGAHGQNGANGRGVQSVTEYYATSSSNSTAPADSAFTTEVPTMDATNKYLWNYELTTYTDSNTARTDKRVIGVFGEDGDNGVSITGVTNHYLATSASSGVTRSTSGWTTTIQTIDATNKYLWNYETITYSSGNPTYTDPTIIGTYGRDGTDGNDGVGISSITEYYARNNSSSSAPADNAFGTNMQAPDASNKYLWNRELITYTNNSTAWTSKRVIGMYSADGAAGKGISAITNYYLASSASSGVTRSTSGWTTDVQTTDVSKPYLWNYEKIEYTSGDPSYSDPAIIGMYSQNGMNGYNTAIVYLYKRSPSAVSVDWTNKLTYTFATNSLNSVPSGWYTSIPSGTDPVYMTAATATSQSATDDILYTEWAAPVMIARNGTDGEPGTAGVGVSSIVEYYAKNNSSSSAPVDGDFTTSVQTPDATNKYLWNRELITYSNSTTTWTSKRVIGMYSADGATGKGISSITEYYTTSTSATTEPGDSSFDTAVPTMDATNKYLWNYELVAYTDGTSEKTGKRVIGTFGKDGSNGNDGVNTATVFLYQRAASSSGLSRPSAALTYTFATGALSGSLGNWSQSIPTNNGNPCYVIQATAVGTGATDSIAASEWSAIKELVADGENGDNGVGITGVTNYYLATNASSGVTRNTSGWTTAVQAVSPTNKYLWNYEKIEYTEGDPTYTDPAIIGVYGDNGVNTAIVNLYKRVSTEKRATGQFVTVRDAGGGLFVRRLEADLQYTQSGSGDPSPSNIRPITGGWTGTAAHERGKNLLRNVLSAPTGSEIDAAGLTWVTNSDGSIHVSGTATADVYRFVGRNTMILPAGTYRATTSGDGVTVTVRHHTGADTSDLLKTDGGTFTIAAPKNVFLRFQVANGTTVDATIYPQIEVGSTNTGYEPFVGYDYAFDWSADTSAGPIGAGTLDVINGVLTVTHIYVDGGDLEWVKRGTGYTDFGTFYSTCASRGTPLYIKSTPTVVSSHFKSCCYTTAVSSADNYVWISEGGNLIVKNTSRSSMSAAEFKAAMAGVTFVYELASPQHYYFESNDVRTSSGLNIFSADDGNLIVQYQADPSIMNVPIDWTTAMTYDFSTSTLSPIPDGWSEEVPSGSDALYITSASVSSSENTGTITYDKWSTPSLISSGSVGYEEIVKSEFQVFSDRIMSAVQEGPLKTVVEQMAGQIAETYSTKAEVSESINGINENYDSLSSGVRTLRDDVDALNGEIVRGWVENPGWESGSIEPQWLLGIAIAKGISVDNSTANSKTDEKGTRFFKINDYQTFGLYTSQGWYIFIDGKKVGWFNGVDGMLHVSKEVIETSLEINDWSITTNSGFGLRYNG